MHGYGCSPSVRMSKLLMGATLAHHHKTQFAKGRNNLLGLKHGQAAAHASGLNRYQLSANKVRFGLAMGSLFIFQY
jgi:hypothetical protein